MKLIAENNFEPISIIMEADKSTGLKLLKIKGPMAVAETKNKNGRVYPATVMESAINKYKSEFIDANRALGELNHPPRLEVDWERASHRLTGLERDGNTWIGEAVVLTTPIGQVLKGLLESGCAIGMSTRGAATVTERNGSKVVGDDFFLRAIDAVSDPSGPGCFVNGIMEGVEFIQTAEGKIIQETVADIAKREYDAKRLTEERKVQMFNNFMSLVSKLGTK